jgi:hypothetical protein
MKKDDKYYAMMLYNQALGDPSIDERDREVVLEYVREEAENLFLEGDDIRDKLNDMLPSEEMYRLSRTVSQKRDEQEQFSGE